MAKSYPNQEFYTKLEEVPKDAEHPYAKMSIEATRRALKDLKNYEYKLYTLLAMNQVDFQLGFSPKQLEMTYGGTRKTWAEARDVLKEKGYLVETSSNHYQFKEMPGSVEEPVLEDTVAEAVFAQVLPTEQKGWDF